MIIELPLSNIALRSPNPKSRPLWNQKLILQQIFLFLHHYNRKGNLNRCLFYHWV